MLVVPTLENMRWRSFPYVTTTLIILNCLIYFIIQAGDDKRELDAYEMYLDSGLLAIEAQAYHHYQKEHEVEEKIPDSLPEDQEELVDVWLILESDVEFQDLLTGVMLTTSEDDEFLEWQHLRQQYETMLTRVIYITYGFKTAWPSWLTAFTSMFLHGSFGHLFGNMVFLFMVGVILESAMGSPLFFFTYLTVGLAESWMTVPFVIGDGLPSVGASGAISGIMGTYSVVMGMTRIPVFYSFGFYFANGRLPAFVLIFFWIGKECYYLIFGGSPGVNYLAHFAGFVAGGAMGWIFREAKGGVGSDLFLDAEDDKKEKSAIALTKGLKCLGEFKFQEARKYVVQALKYDPKNLEILIHLFNIDKQHPESSTFQKTNIDLLAVLVDRAEYHGKLLYVVREYNKLCNTPGIPPDLVVRIVRRFAVEGNIPEVVFLMDQIMRTAPDHEQIPDCLLMCGRACVKKSLTKEGENFFDLLHSKFPDTMEARVASATTSQP